MALLRICICVAEGSMCDLNPHFAGLRGCHLDILNLEILACLPCYSSFISQCHKWSVKKGFEKCNQSGHSASPEDYIKLKLHWSMQDISNVLKLYWIIQWAWQHFSSSYWFRVSVFKFMSKLLIKTEDTSKMGRILPYLCRWWLALR